MKICCKNRYASSIQLKKLSNAGQSLDGLPKIYYLEFFRASEGTEKRCWSRLHWQSLKPTNPHWPCMVGFSPFSLCVIHKEGLCPSSGDVNRLMMVILYSPFATSTRTIEKRAFYTTLS
jgi:hypothetical protein